MILQVRGLGVLPRISVDAKPNYQGLNPEMSQFYRQE